MYDEFGRFVRLLLQLVKRPRRGETPPHQGGVSPRWGLPLLCVVRSDDNEQVLEEIREYLRNARPAPVPHALHEFQDTQVPPTPEATHEPVTHADVEHVATALTSIAEQLLAGWHKKYGRMGFRRFELVHWLMNQRVDGTQLSHDAELTRLIRQFEASRRSRATPPESVREVFPWWARLTMWLVPPLWFGLRLRAGAQYRWFLRQPFLAPHDPGTFLGFAQRITGWLGDRPGRKAGGESAEELLSLLVNAFLEDVRRAYRRRLRPRGARRTAYPVVLLDRITRRNGGYRLLETVNRVRNETGLFDPLLFVSTSRKVPPDAYAPGNMPKELWDMSKSHEAYGHWQAEFWRASRAREHAAWYLPVRGEPAVGPVNQPPLDELKLPRPPWWSRAAVVPTAVVLVVALVVGGILWLDRNREREEQAWQDKHCGLARSAAFADYLLTVDGECIGVSAEPVPVFEAPAELREVQTVITRQNTEAERLREKSPKRSFISVAYVSEISATAGIQPAEVERLQGIAARQRRQLDGNIADPLVRIVFVNAGREMRHGPRAAAMLAKLAAEDRTLVGVVGLAVSSRATVETIKAIGRAGLPMVASSLTADGIQRESPLYYQIAPQNRREAQVAVRYARDQLRVTGPVTVVTSSDEDDLYASTLAADVREEFTRAGFVVRSRVYTPSPDLGTPDEPEPREVGQNLCGTGGLVFYTGRPADFEQLLDGVNGTCRSAPPRLLAGDDVSRYVANKKQLEHFPEIPFDYFALAPGGQDCFSGGELSNTLRELFTEQCEQMSGSFLADDGSTAYDALTVVVAAVNQLRGTVVSPGAVWHMISRLTGAKRVDGTSGVIDFGRGGAQVPLDKFVAIMRVDGLGAPTVQGTCGDIRKLVPATWCP